MSAVISIFSKTKRLEERRKKLVEQEAELKGLELAAQKAQEAQERRIKVLIKEKAEKLVHEQIAIAEVELAHESSRARKKHDKLRKDALFQERKAIEAEEKLLAQQHYHAEAMRMHEQQARNMTSEAHRRYADEKRARELAEHQLQDILAHAEAKRLQAADDLRRARDEERRQVEKLERAQKALEEKLRSEEKRRQRDEVQNGNSPKALRELRELIRSRYELDVEIWQNRDDVETNRRIWVKKMAQSDAVLLEIQNKIQKWDHLDEASGWSEEEWEMAKEVRERLLKSGKRNWATDPPWSEGVRKPPIVNRPRGPRARKAVAAS